MTSPSANPSSAWSRGFHFGSSASGGSGAAQPAAASANSSAAAGGSWRAAAAGQSVPQARWGAAGASKPDVSTDSLVDESGGRSWFDGSADRGGAAAAANSSASVWRSHRVDKIKDSAAITPSSSLTNSQGASGGAKPASAQPQQQQQQQSEVYQPSDFGPNHLQNVKWYYLDPQREYTAT
jgi:hypothetical protein